MIVCHCQGVSERAIRKAVRAGACNHREIARACKAGASCGGCLPSVAEILEAERREDACPALAPLAVGAS